MKILTDKGNVFTIETCDGGAVLTTSETLDQEKVDDMTAAYEALRGFIPTYGIWSKASVRESTTSRGYRCPNCDGVGWIYSSAVESGSKCTRCRGTGRIT
jgi:hypothetical protein